MIQKGCHQAKQADYAKRDVVLENNQEPPHGKPGINIMDKDLCCMIIEYKMKLASDGFEYNPAHQEKSIVNLHDSNDEKDYVDFATIGT